MGPYETCPWSAHDGEKGITCNAEVRMNEDANLLEAEVMLIFDTPPAGGTPIDLVFRIDCKPVTGDMWEAFRLTVRGADKTNSFHEWDKKAFSLFSACVQELKMDKVPDIEELLKKELREEDESGTNSRGGGSKAPKIKPQSLLGMKGGRGF